MWELTKTQILERFVDAKCVVSYNNGRKIEYDSLKHINWRNALKITILFDVKKYKNYRGEVVPRGGVAIKII